MRRDRHSRKHIGNWKNNTNNRRDFEDRKNFQPSKPVFRPTIKSVSPEQIQHDEEAIKNSSRQTSLYAQSADKLSGTFRLR